MKVKETAAGNAAPPRGPAGGAEPASTNDAPRANWALAAVLLVGVMTGAFALPSFIVLICGLLPAGVAAMIDGQRGRHATLCVLAANLAGLAPVLVALWSGGNDLVAAIGLLSDVYNWFTMYGAAAVGWGLVWLWPALIDLALGLAAARRMRQLRAHQERLAKEWGLEIAAGT